MTRSAKRRTVWPAALGLAAVLLGAHTVLASVSTSSPTYVGTPVSGPSFGIAVRVGVERTSSPIADFLYDTLSRLKTANLYAPLSGGGTATQQSYTYDNYANLTAIGGINVPASSTTYRPAGQGVEHVHIYTADDERLWTYSPGSPSRWTLRDLDGRVLREFSNNAGTWSIFKDYVYRGTTLVAAVQTDGQTHHFHPDHLGTPRLITNGTGGKLAYHVYYPYGVELSSIGQDGERLKFTGHERDLGVSWSAADDLDYMHARFYNPQVGRFLSVDPVLGGPENPQSWNRYTYVLDNPIRFSDPTGMVLVGGDQLVKTLQNALTRTGSGDLAKTLALKSVPVKRSALFGLITWTTTETRVTGDVNALARSDNPIANLIAQTIKTKTHVHVNFTSDDLSHASGALTQARLFETRNKITISINPAQVSAANLPTAQGQGGISPSGALVHELGHAWGHFAMNRPFYPRVMGLPGPTDAQAIYWENTYRDATNLPRRTQH